MEEREKEEVGEVGEVEGERIVAKGERTVEVSRLKVGGVVKGEEEVEMEGNERKGLEKHEKEEGQKDVLWSLC
jgi:hypothetical protein